MKNYYRIQISFEIQTISGKNEKNKKNKNSET